MQERLTLQCVCLFKWAGMVCVCVWSAHRRGVGSVSGEMSRTLEQITVEDVKEQTRPRRERCWDGTGLLRRSESLSGRWRPRLYCTASIKNLTSQTSAELLCACVWPDTFLFHYPVIECVCVCVCVWVCVVFDQILSSFIIACYSVWVCVSVCVCEWVVSECVLCLTSYFPLSL